MEGNRFWILCNCGMCEHQALLQYHNDEEWPEIYMRFHLGRLRNRFFGRVWGAIKYVFGHRSRYGDWDEVCISPEVAAELRDYLDAFLAPLDGARRRE